MKKLYSLLFISLFLFVTLPLIVVTYYFISPHYPFGLILSVEQYLRANISRDRFYIMGLFGIVTAAYLATNKFKEHWISVVIMEGLPALWLFLGMIGSALGILLIFKLKQGPIVQFPVTEKYLIYLTPVGIITVTIFVDRMMRAV